MQNALKRKTVLWTKEIVKQGIEDYRMSFKEEKGIPLNNNIINAFFVNKKNVFLDHLCTMRKLNLVYKKPNVSKPSLWNFRAMIVVLFQKIIYIMIPISVFVVQKSPLNTRSGIFINYLSNWPHNSRVSTFSGGLGSNKCSASLLYFTRNTGFQGLFSLHHYNISHDLWFQRRGWTGCLIQDEWRAFKFICNWV